MPKISVIVPVYNAEKSLRRCVESVLNQTFADYELLLINDGSLDNSGDICDDYARKDKRIKIFHKFNGGVSSARNKGLANAQGQYICFIDSDDWIDPEYLESFFPYSVKEDKYVFVIQGIKKDFEKETREYLSLENKFWEISNISNLFYEYRLLNFGFPFSKLYNAEIITNNKIYFDEQIHFSEDLLFMLKYLKHIKYIHTSSNSFYHYVRTAENSLSKTNYPYEMEYIFFVKLKQDINKLLNKFAFTEDCKGYIKAFLGNVFLRVIQSLYRPMYKKDCLHRLAALKKLLTEENIEYLIRLQKSRKNNFFYSSSIFLLRYRLYHFFNFYYKFYFYLRYRHENYRKIFIKKSFLCNLNKIKNE